MFRISSKRHARGGQAAAIIVLAGLGFGAATGTAAAQAATDANAGIAGSLGSCSVYLPPETTTIVYDTYGGGLPSKYEFANPPKHVFRTEITAPKKDAPLFLVLIANAATEWDMNVEPGARVLEILVLGYEKQIVSHVPATTEVGFSIQSAQSGGTGSGCPNSVYWTDRDLEPKVHAMLSNRFSRTLDEHYRSSSEECAVKGCLGFSKAKSPEVSLWRRLFGPAVPPPPERSNRVRASADIVVR